MIYLILSVSLLTFKFLIMAAIIAILEALGIIDEEGNW